MQLQTDEAERMDHGIKSEMRGGWQRGGGCIPQPGRSCTQPQLIARSEFFFSKEAGYLSFHLKLTTHSDLFFVFCFFFFSFFFKFYF